MAELAEDTSASSPAAPHQPPYNYTANRGYEPQAHDIPPEVRQRRGVPPPADVGSADLEDDDDDVDEIFDEGGTFEPELEDEALDGHAHDIAKSYNRQHQLADPAAVAAAPRPNQQKPKANTFASVDDQVSALARHAAKIRLDSVKQDDARDKDKADRATSEQVLDRRTRMILLQMINRGVVSKVHGAVSTGKEANVYGAVLQPEDDGAPLLRRAIKVYKTAILSFKDRERYITGEHRFKSGYEKGNNRKMVKLWAEKEFRNLRRIYNAGILCPEPLYLKLHVLVMGFLGDRRGWAYPRLRDAVLDGEDVDQQWRSLYVQLLTMMRKMYQVCRLVHADLSEYNILYHERKLYIIDVSQSVEPDHPRALDFLRMDIKNVSDFFRRAGVDVLSERAIFHFITDPTGPVEEPDASATVAALFAQQQRAAANGADAAETELDDIVFRNQYIPRTLRQVADIDRDVAKLRRRQGEELVYRTLLADQVVRPVSAERGEEDEGESSSEDESGSGAALHGDGSGSEEEGEKARPRGRRFEDKEEKKQHKQAVKEAKREKRKEKMPKHVKKKLISSTTRRKK